MLLEEGWMCDRCHTITAKSLPKALQLQERHLCLTCDNLHRSILRYRQEVKHREAIRLAIIRGVRDWK